MKKFLMYVALIVLLFLLFLPLGLQLFGSKLYIDTPSAKKSDVMLSLKCIKSNETIKMTYLNDKPYSFWYQIVGEINVTPGNEEANKIVNDVAPYSKKEYSIISSATEYKIDLYNYNENNTPNELINYMKNPNDQSIYYSTFGFICSLSNI